MQNSVEQGVIQPYSGLVVCATYVEKSTQAGSYISEEKQMACFYLAGS